jgi:hypothetical protein
MDATPVAFNVPVQGQLFKFSEGRLVNRQVRHPRDRLKTRQALNERHLTILPPRSDFFNGLPNGLRNPPIV